MLCLGHLLLKQQSSLALLHIIVARSTPVFGCPQHLVSLFGRPHAYTTETSLKKHLSYQGKDQFVNNPVLSEVLYFVSQ